MVWGHLAVAAVSIGANLLIRYTQSDPEVRRVGLLRGRPSINAQYVLGQSRAPAYMVGHRVAAEPFVGVTTESDSGFRSIHLALCLSEGACEDLLGVWFNDIYYRLSRVRTEIDGAVLYNSHDRIAPYASRRGNLFEVRGCLDATGMQGAVYRRALGLPAGAPFLKYISWAHVVLQQPGNADDPARIHKWQRVPDISFLMKGMKVPPATAPGDPARWTPDATDLRYWFMRERLKIPAAEINAPSVAARPRDHVAAHPHRSRRRILALLAGARSTERRRRVDCGGTGADGAQFGRLGGLGAAHRHGQPPGGQRAARGPIASGRSSVQGQTRERHRRDDRGAAGRRGRAVSAGGRPGTKPAATR